ncbi:hypothetical protein [Pectobacterium parmentieri]|uniref:hypothetical protein n=1 Tax=Pectobacterium parmentieri TaxID=1905730 RepID=UPI000CDDCF5F|nr:hypothetical protein [Pectobacterium parmentieri]AYH04388.1 hypothetical protein C5E25_02830 [Pectobacterium parmentieri]AYH13210.1 hypothetical protein C5E23_02815 [Pectobacterium parmentieri]AYH21912.1 hypothetical protein C5E21_02810 [Pectobacterium parmentieri]MBN3177605.1 hypothetical protein [Pectobacterium parmentieri]POW28353.1 hypothetical protein PB20LOC_01547 [Pectobacterium parmentieri]
MIKPELKPLTPVQPGYALLLLRAWKGGEEGVTISVLRNQDHLYLDDSGRWSSGEVFLTLSPLTPYDDVPGVQVGPDFLDPLLANRQAAYRITVKDIATTDVGVLTITDGLLSSQASGESNPLANVRPVEDAPVQETPIPEPQPAPEPELPTPAPQPEERVDTAGDKPKSSKKGVLVAIAILILILLAAAAWWFTRSPAPAGTTSTAPPVAKVSGPCGDDQMKNSNELEFVKGCLRSQPSSAQLLDVISKAKAEKHCDIAQRLYAYKAQSGDTQMAMRYAQEYDPKTAQSGGCFSPDAQTAVYWYETIVNNDPQNNEARARLTALKK